MADGMTFDPDTEWLDHVRPTGVVIAGTVLKELGLPPERQTAVETAEVAALIDVEGEGAALKDPWPFFEHVLGWPASRVAGAPGGPELPSDLCVSLPEYQASLAPTWAVRQAGQEDGWQLLVCIEAEGVDPDARGALDGWEATPHQRFERLLREIDPKHGVAAGVLITDNELRLVYAPRGETSGWASWPLRSLAGVAGRPMLAGLKLVLNAFRLFNDGADRRLPALLKRSREAQAAVSTKLAEQVLGALHELLRGLNAAEPEIVGRIAAQEPGHLYEGLLTVLMRLVFVLYAEDRDLIPSATNAEMRNLYDQGYSVRNLLAKLQDDSALYPDTMDERQGAWGRLIALFRLIHGGHAHWIQARGGKLFDPEQFWFLEGREFKGHEPRIIKVSDGCVHRILDRLMIVNGERISYRGLDVEQIGSVYETVMGFTVDVGKGPTLAIKAGKNNKVPVFVDLAALTSKKADERIKALKDECGRASLTAKQQAAIKQAEGVDGLAAALEGIVDERGSPQKRVAPAGTPILQPTDERRRTGSHYTPRSLTEPIVRHALEPAFERLGEDATPEDVLSLKVCDPAMGSGAFLVEACRALAARLVKAWAKHPGTRPTIPPDEDEELHARRLVSQRCLYGVDKNPMATDLARLSLWLATLAKDHEFTFLDHALRTGDSLVGLSLKQIAACHWNADKPGAPLISMVVRQKVEAALAARKAILEAPDDVSRAIQEGRYREVEKIADAPRIFADAIVAAFFRGARPRERETYRRELEMQLSALDVQGIASAAQWGPWLEHGAHPIRPFHWEIEYPEVFARENSGFDAIVGNPPFVGGSILSGNSGQKMLEWLVQNFAPAHGKSDLVAFFFRRAFELTRSGGSLGLLATKTIRQGASRYTGLEFIIGNGGSIYRALTRMSWPGDAAVVVCSIHLKKGAIVQPVLDGKTVDTVTSFLLPFGPNQRPPSLRANAEIAFSGVNPNGEGFVLTPEERDEVVHRSQQSATFIAPYLSSNDFNGEPDTRPSRFIVNVGHMEEEELRQHELVYKRLRDSVRPERASSSERRLRDVWWAFSRPAAGLYRRIASLPRVLVMGRLATHHTLGFQDITTIFSDALTVFALDRFGGFSVLQSRSHEIWAKFIGSAFKDDPRYIPEDCFETFPFPLGFETDPALEAAGRTYHNYRAALMIETNKGMTPTYNRFHDRYESADDIARLRALHAEMDAAVLRAYGWDDLAARAQAIWLDDQNEDDHKYEGRLFWPAEFRDEVLARLLALNAERAAAEKAEAASK